MRIKTIISIVILILSAPYMLNAQEADDIFTIYLVRHAEKEVSAENPKDPPLTSCGELRAESLAKFFWRNRPGCDLQYRIPSVQKTRLNQLPKNKEKCSVL